MGMTTAFFHDFFPSLGRALMQHVPDLWHWVQPAHIVAACPEADLQVGPAAL